jgi:hypothetical protein
MAVVVQPGVDIGSLGMATTGVVDGFTGWVGRLGRRWHARVEDFPLGVRDTHLAMARQHFADIDVKQIGKITVADLCLAHHGL